MSDLGPPTDGSLELIGQIVKANSDQLKHVTDQLLEGYKAERDCTWAILRAALATIPFGGTTAEYEAGLDRVKMALYPPQEWMQVYQRRAAQYLAGENEEPEPEMFSAYFTRVL